MKLQQILFAMFTLVLAMPMLANAEIYKWKDRNGVVRYSDMAPTSDVKVDIIGKTKKQVTYIAPSASEETGKRPRVAEEATREKFEARVDPEEAAAKLRARNAQAEKKNNEEKVRQAKLNAENCKAARANYQSYVQGGRVYTTSENGERQYLGDAELEAGKVKTKAEMEEYCH